MNRTQSKILWRAVGGLGVFFFLCSLIITFIEYRKFTGQPSVFPGGSTVAGVPVGGLTPGEAETRLTEFYDLPLILEIDGATIHATPAELGFTIDIPALALEGLHQVKTTGFWASLWNNNSNLPPVEVPLSASVDQNRILAYLNNEIAPRYTQPGSLLAPIPFTTNFNLSSSGNRLDVEEAAANIENALQTPSQHQVHLRITPDSGGSPTGEILEAFLRHNINWVGFNGLVELYLESMTTGQVVHFADWNGQQVAPDVSFTAASTIKIPIMISVLRRTSEPTPETVVTLLNQMIGLSENAPADTLMKFYLNEIRGPLIVSEDLAELGMENTFLAGYFEPSPALELFITPANTRTDIDIDPDIYTQTVSSEAGKLLRGIYECAEDGSGLLPETFPGEITQGECQLMMDVLAANQIGSLIEAGLPPEGRAAHKHGWVLEPDGIFRPMSDVAIVFTPDGDYVLNIFIYDPDRLDFDEGNRLTARLSQTVYNFFNLENQAHWWFDTR